MRCVNYIWPGKSAPGSIFKPGLSFAGCCDAVHLTWWVSHGNAGCWVFGLHDATLGAQANISRLGKQQTLCVCRGGFEPGAVIMVQLSGGQLQVSSEGTFPAGQGLPLNPGGWAQGWPPQVPALLQSIRFSSKSSCSYSLWKWHVFCNIWNRFTVMKPWKIDIQCRKDWIKIYEEIFGSKLFHLHHVLNKPLFFPLLPQLKFYVSKKVLLRSKCFLMIFFLIATFNFCFVFSRGKTKSWFETLCWKPSVQKHSLSIFTVRNGRSHLYCLQHEHIFLSWW